MNTPTTAVETGTTVVKFRFKTIKAGDKRHAPSIAAWTAAGKTWETDKEGGICRAEESHSLVIPSIGEFSPAFVAARVVEWVESAAKKLYVDKCLPIGSLTTSVIEAALTATVRQAALPEGANDLMVKFIEASMTERKRPAAMISIVLDMARGRFGEKVMAKHAKQSEHFPMMLAGIVLYVQEFTGKVNALPEGTEEEQTLKAGLQAQLPTLQLVADHYQSRYAAVLEGMIEAEEEVDFTAM